MGAAVLLFWMVGAYNRLVALRNRLAQLFAPVEAHFRQRHALLIRLAEALDPQSPGGELLQAASRQAEGALIHALVRPSAAGPVTSLRLAEQILADVRGRVPAQALAEPEMAGLCADLGGPDAALAFAKQQFNEAARAYNAAVAQFPTLLIAGMFGFRSAGTL